MKKTIYKLGSKVTDIATDIPGTLTMVNIDMSGNEFYLLQPKGLNPETQKPSDSFFIGKNRFVGCKTEIVELPTELFARRLTDKVTGFKGMAIEINYHMTGCIHIVLKPKGTNTIGDSIDPQDFDVKRLEGKAMKLLSGKEKNKKPDDSPGLVPMRFKR